MKVVVNISKMVVPAEKLHLLEELLAGAETLDYQYVGNGQPNIDYIVPGFEARVELMLEDRYELLKMTYKLRQEAGGK